jgi:hypothetical protein
MEGTEKEEERDDTRRNELDSRLRVLTFTFIFDYFVIFMRVAR